MTLLSRYSGRTEKELSQELGNGEVNISYPCSIFIDNPSHFESHFKVYFQIRRNPPHFTRVPSQRFSRRSRSEEGEKRRGAKCFWSLLFTQELFLHSTIHHPRWEHTGAKGNWVKPREPGKSPPLCQQRVHSVPSWNLPASKLWHPPYRPPVSAAQCWCGWRAFVRSGG